MREREIGGWVPFQGGPPHDSTPEGCMPLLGQEGAHPCVCMCPRDSGAPPSSSTHKPFFSGPSPPVGCTYAYPHFHTLPTSPHVRGVPCPRMVQTVHVPPHPHQPPTPLSVVLNPPPLEVALGRPPPGPLAGGPPWAVVLGRELHLHLLWSWGDRGRVIRTM